MDSIMTFGTRDLAMSSSLVVQTGTAVLFGTAMPSGTAASFGEWIAVEQRKQARSVLGTANRVRLCTAIGADVRTTHPMLTSAAEP